MSKTKPPRPLEKHVQAACWAILELHGCRVFRRNTGQMPAEYKGKRRVFKAGETGAADLYGWFPDRTHYECEIKRPGERPTRKQVLFLRDCAARGIPAFWTDSADDLARFLPVLIAGGRVVYLDDPWTFREKDKATGRVVVRTEPGGEFEIHKRSDAGRDMPATRKVLRFIRDYAEYFHRRGTGSIYFTVCDCDQGDEECGHDLILRRDDLDAALAEWEVNS